MEEYKVEFNIPKYAKYIVTAEYRGAAISKAALKHQKFLPELSFKEVKAQASCHLVDPKSSGGRYKEPSFIEKMYKRGFGEQEGS